MGTQDIFTDPPFDAQFLGPNGKVSNIWRRWIEQNYEWVASDPLQRIQLERLSQIVLSKDGEPPEDPGVDWARGLQGILERLDDLEGQVATQEVLRNVTSDCSLNPTVSDVTATRTLGVVYQNTNSTMLDVRVSVRLS